MKTKLNSVLSAVALSLIFGMCSCKKDYSCECETKVSGSGYSSTTTTKESYSAKLKEKQAKAACDNTGDILKKQIEDQMSGSGLNVSVSCEVK